MRSIKIDLDRSESIMVHSDASQIILQVRRLVHDAADPLAPSFKSAVNLDAAAALKLAGELLLAASRQLASPR